MPISSKCHAQCSKWHRKINKSSADSNDPFALFPQVPQSMSGFGIDPHLFYAVSQSAESAESATSLHKQPLFLPVQIVYRFTYQGHSVTATLDHVEGSADDVKRKYYHTIHENEVLPSYVSGYSYPTLSASARAIRPTEQNGKLSWYICVPDTGKYVQIKEAEKNFYYVNTTHFKRQNPAPSITKTKLLRKQDYTDNLVSPLLNMPLRPSRKSKHKRDEDRELD